MEQKMKMAVETVVDQRMFERCNVVVAEEMRPECVDGFSELSALLWNQDVVRVAGTTRM